jgi:hypothetical protein
MGCAGRTGSGHSQSKIALPVHGFDAGSKVRMAVPGRVPIKIVHFFLHGQYSFNAVIEVSSRTFLLSKQSFCRAGEIVQRSKIVNDSYLYSIRHQIFEKNDENECSVDSFP